MNKKKLQYKDLRYILKCSLIDKLNYSLYLKADNKRLTEACMRSEFENEMLALELVNDRIKLKGNLHDVC